MAYLPISTYQIYRVLYKHGWTLFTAGNLIKEINCLQQCMHIYYILNFCVYTLYRNNKQLKKWHLSFQIRTHFYEARYMTRILYIGK